MTPSGEALLFSSLKPAGIVPPPKRRLPLPMVTGNILSHHSSARSCCKRVWMRLLLPCTCSSAVLGFELFYLGYNVAA
jgi:hypothetical protein